MESGEKARQQDLPRFQRRLPERSRKLGGDHAAAAPSTVRGKSDERRHRKGGLHRVLAAHLERLRRQRVRITETSAQSLPLTRVSQGGVANCLELRRLAKNVQNAMEC